MMHRFFKKTDLSACPIFLLIVSLIWAESVKAKELYFQPSFNVITEYDSNKRLRTKKNQPGIDRSSYGIITRVGAKLGARSNRYNIKLDNQFILNRYASDLDLDSEDFNFNLTSSYNLTEKSQFGVSASYKRDTTLTSELDGTGSGIVQDNIQRRLWSVSPYWSYSFSNTHSFQASYSHSETDYNQSDVGTFSDYTVDNFSVNFRQQWTPLFSSFINGSAMLFSVPEIDSSIRTVGGVIRSEIEQDVTEYSITVGGEYQFLPTWSASFSVGPRFNTTESTTTIPNTTFEQSSSTDTTAFIYSVGIDKTFETGKASVNYSRSTNPQGQGRLQVRDLVDISYEYRVNQKVQLNLTARFNDISTSGDVDDGNARTYYGARPSVRWSINEQARLVLFYQYRAQKFDRDDETAVSNSVGLNFNYQWDKIATQKY